MKRSVRPFLSILILIAIGISLSCRIAVRRGSATLGPENIVHVETPARPVFNSTLLEFAAIDLGEASLTRETTQLLDGDFGPKRRFRSISSWHRSRQDINPMTFRGNRAFDIWSPNFYRLWLESKSVLENWSRNRRYQPDIMTELVRLVKLRIDRRIPSAGSSQRYSSCAVVGNSGILLKSHHGGLIDSHEVVIRLNNAKIENYEGHVGSKTNISFVNSNLLHLCARREGCFCQPYGMNVPMVMYICQAAHFLDYTICNSPRKVPLLITDPRFDVLCARIVKYYSVKRFVEVMGKPLEQWSSAHEGSMFHYSSGMQAVMLALGICDKVSIFGFGKSELAKHHYHTSQMGELHLHDYEAEYAFYHDLIERPQFHNVPRMDKGAKTVKECVGNFASIPALPKAVWDQYCRN